MTKKDGGPAFPHPGRHTGEHEGMTLRDYFAAKAMQGLLASEGDDWLVAQVGRNEPIAERSKAIATASYILADVMLEVRGGAKRTEVGR